MHTIQKYVYFSSFLLLFVNFVYNIFAKNSFDGKDAWAIILLFILLVNFGLQNYKLKELYSPIELPTDYRIERDIPNNILML